MKREYRDHQGREWFALHVRTGEERDVALAVYGLGDADSLLPVEHYTTRGQEHERILARRNQRHEADEDPDRGHGHPGLRYER